MQKKFLKDVLKFSASLLDINIGYQNLATPILVTY